MNRTAHRLMIVLGVALVATAFAQDSATLKRVAKVGDTLRYSFNADADFGGQRINISAVVTDKVIEVNADGSYAAESVQSDTVLRFGDQEMPMNQESKQVVRYAANGVLLELKGDQVDPGTYRLAAMNTFVAPAAAVKVGDKWTWDAKADAKTGTVAAKAEYEVLAFETVNGVATAKIGWTYTENEGNERASMKATAWIEVANGALYKLDADIKGAPITGAPGPVDMTLKLERK